VSLDLMVRLCFSAYFYGISTFSGGRFGKSIEESELLHWVEVLGELPWVNDATLVFEPWTLDSDLLI